MIIINHHVINDDEDDDEENDDVKNELLRTVEVNAFVNNVINHDNAKRGTETVNSKL